jgi:pimeloyl-ACP methyl ester carboxylesterase
MTLFHYYSLGLNNLADFKNNDKSSAVLEYCKRHNRNFLSFDWFGRGGSTGKLMEATISRWTSDTIEFLDKEAKHVKGGIAGVKAVLVGVGVGGWVAVLVALRRPDLVRGIVGLSADPDFTEDLLWSKLPDSEKQAIMKDGFREVTWGGRQVTSYKNLLCTFRRHTHESCPNSLGSVPNYVDSY